jgi:hypothetical protein
MKAFEIKGDEYCLCGVCPRNVDSDADLSQVQIPLRRERRRSLKLSHEFKKKAK